MWNLSAAAVLVCFQLSLGIIVLTKLATPTSIPSSNLFTTLRHGALPLQNPLLADHILPASSAHSWLSLAKLASHAPLQALSAHRSGMISPSDNSNESAKCTSSELPFFEVSTPDTGAALVDVVHVYNLREAFTSRYGYGTRWMLPSTSYSQARILTFATKPRKPNVYEAGHVYKKQVALNLFDILASERASSGTTTNPLIFIAHDCGAQVVSRALHLATGVPTAKRASFESILDLTYGVVFVPSRRHRRHRLARALILAAGQLACYITLRNYENIHDARIETCVAFSPAHTNVSRNTTEESKTSGPSSSAEICSHVGTDVLNQVNRVIFNVRPNIKSYRYLRRFFHIFSTRHRAPPRPSLSA